ncbi:MAG: 3-deoxy-7-phosphoheptulonate synthase, partial [bacterium]
DRQPGRLTLICRFGAQKIQTCLPPLIEAVQKVKHPVLWAVDPMHGNTVTTDHGIKTRHFDQILSEVRDSFLIHQHHDTIVGGICVYLLLGLCFAISFMLIAELAPTAFSLAAELQWDAGDRKLDFLYFSFVTLTTLGYGDIAPHGDLAQMLCVAEALIGQLYLAVFVARLVAQHLARPSK